MNDHRASMSDDELDRTIARYLGWRAGQVQGAPDASDMARRLVGALPATRQRRARGLLVLGVAAVLVLTAVGALSVATRSPAVTDPFADSRLIVADARGWKVVAPATEAMSMEPCDGLCPTGMWPVASLDGQTVFYVETTPVLEDLSVADPGWSLWRWDRREDSVARVAGCGPTLCTMGPPSPSPDGRHVAYLELPSPAPDPPETPTGAIVVVDAVTGRPVVRTPVRIGWIAKPAWDANGRLLMVTLGPPWRPRDSEYRRVDLATGQVEEIGTDLPRGNHIISSPDGQTILIDVTDYATWNPGTVKVLVADQALTTARPGFVIDDVAGWSGPAWAPSGTAFANVVTTSHHASAGEVWTYDLSSDAMTSLGDHGLMESSLLWLPDD